MSYETLTAAISNATRNDADISQDDIKKILCIEQPYIILEDLIEGGINIGGEKPSDEGDIGRYLRKDEADELRKLIADIKFQKFSSFPGAVQQLEEYIQKNEGKAEKNLAVLNKFYSSVKMTLGASGSVTAISWKYLGQDAALTLGGGYIASIAFCTFIISTGSYFDWKYKD